MYSLISNENNYCNFLVLKDIQDPVKYDFRNNITAGDEVIFKKYRE